MWGDFWNILKYFFDKLLGHASSETTQQIVYMFKIKLFLRKTKLPTERTWF